MIRIHYLMKNFLMKIKFQKIAKEEYDDALNYYNDENKTLGIKFKNEIKQSINNISKFPTLYPKINEHIRKCVTHTFPFTIFYIIKDDSIFILAIANHYKNPEYYIQRFSN